jgi:hypothetical protein
MPDRINPGRMIDLAELHGAAYCKRTQRGGKNPLFREEESDCEKHHRCIQSVAGVFGKKLRQSNEAGADRETQTDYKNHAQGG